MHYQEGQDRNQMFVTSLEEMVKDDSWARIVDLFVDSIPLEDFGFANMELKKEDERTGPAVRQDEGPGNLRVSEPRQWVGQPYHPSDLFKLLLYGYRRRIRSSLKLAEACKINVEVMWLVKGLRPSTRTINYF